MFALWSSPNRMLIKYRGPIKKRNQIIPSKGISTQVLEWFWLMIHIQPQLRLCFALGSTPRKLIVWGQVSLYNGGLGNHTKKAHSRYESHITFIFQGLQKHERLCPNLHKRASRSLLKLEESHAVLVQFSSMIQVHIHLWFDFVFTYNRLLQQSHPILHPAEAMSHEMPALKQETHYQKSVRTHIS